MWPTQDHVIIHVITWSLLSPFSHDLCPLNLTECCLWGRDSAPKRLSHHFLFFSSFSFLLLFLDRLPEIFLQTFNHALPRRDVTKIRLILWTRGKSWHKNYSLMCFRLFLVNGIYCIQKSTKNSQKQVFRRWHMIREYKEREIKLKIKKFEKRQKEKISKRRNLLVHHVKLM